MYSAAHYWGLVTGYIINGSDPWFTDSELEFQNPVKSLRDCMMHDSLSDLYHWLIFIIEFTGRTAVSVPSIVTKYRKQSGLKYFGRRRVLCVQTGLRGPGMGAGLGTLPLPATAREEQTEFELDKRGLTVHLSNIDKYIGNEKEKKRKRNAFMKTQWTFTICLWMWRGHSRNVELSRYYDSSPCRWRAAEGSFCLLRPAPAVCVRKKSNEWRAGSRAGGCLVPDVIGIDSNWSLSNSTQIKIDTSLCLYM